MNKSNCILITFFMILSVGASTAFAQAERTVEPSFEIVLQTLAGSDDPAARGNLPDSLSAISGKLKSSFAISNFKVISTQLQRVANKGSLNFRTVLVGLNADVAATVISNWGIESLNFSGDSDGLGVAAFRSFSFQAEFPYKTTVFNEKTNGMVPVSASDQIALRTQNLNIPVNEPTLIGTLAVPKSDKNIFLVITVRRF